MAKPPSNLFTVLSLDPHTEGEDEEEDEEKANSMPSSKQHLSKKKRRKSKKENNIAEALQLSSLTIHGDSQQTKADPPLASLLTHNYTAVPPTISSSGKTAAPTTKAASTSYLKWPLVWIDLEMTGLDVERDRILEIACIITDGKLQETLEGPDLIINQSEELLASMGEWCQSHHSANGLIEAVRKSKVTEKEAETKVMEFVRLHTGSETKQPLLAGNSVYVDFLFLQRYMPNLAALFPHVVVDVSSVKALCLRWFPKDAERAPAKKKTHRALEDIKESIAELKYMQKSIFKEAKR